METIQANQLDTWLAQLKEKQVEWESTPLARRLELLSQLREATYRVAARWVEVCCQIKGLDPKSQRAGEEWAIGPVITLRNMRLLEKQIQSAPREGGRVLRALPADSWDIVQWAGLTGETWSLPGFGPASAVRGKVGLVLGAGNVSSISATDVLYKIFVEDQTVLLKMNPIHEPLGPVLEEAFACLIEGGFLRIVSGDAAAGALAVRHSGVEAVHVTGSHHTYDAIRLSVGPELPITAELGCVSPVIVAPGRWSNRSLAYHARHIAGMLTTNAGFNCNAAQVLVTCKQWPQRERFLAEVRRALSKVPSRPAYYPGARERYQSLLNSYPQAERLGAPQEGAINWTLVTDLDPNSDERAFREEAFCGVLYEVALDTPYAEFLGQAATFCNEKLWGNLSCTLLISPESQRTLPWRRALEKLRYGAIGVNAWAGLIFALVNLPWGAYPGNPPEDIQSGLGYVHNTANVGSVEKTLLFAPFWTPIRMPWHAGFARMRSFAQALTDFEYQPGWKNLLRCHWELLRGGVGM